MNPVVHVLLATYNGAAHLAEQWASLEMQQGVDIVLHVGDDGSSDDTVAIAERLASARSGAVKEVVWLRGPRRGSATRNFLSLLAAAVRERPEAKWFSYCDQDDIWLPGKLSAAIAALGSADAAQPMLYGGRTLIVDEDGRERHLSRLFQHAPCFANALVQNIMGGNTMLMNRAAAELVAGSADAEVVTHDWLTYQLVSGAGGHVYYDSRAYLRYRQHENNEIGSNTGWPALGARLWRMLMGDYRSWNARGVAALLQRRDVLTPANLATLEAFARAREGRNPFTRLRWLVRSGAFRRPWSQHATLLAASLLRRI